VAVCCFALLCLGVRFVGPANAPALATAPGIIFSSDEYASFSSSVAFFHVLFVGSLRARADETFLLQEPMLTNTHLSVLGCRFVAFDYSL
jgi:hypothetical protein